MIIHSLLGVQWKISSLTIARLVLWEKKNRKNDTLRLVTAIQVNWHTSSRYLDTCKLSCPCWRCANVSITGMTVTNLIVSVLGGIFAGLFLPRTVKPKWKNLHQLSQRLTPLGIMRDQLKASFQSIVTIVLWCSRCSLNWDLIESPVSRTAKRLTFAYFGHVRTDKSFRNVIKSNQNQIVFTIFRLI